MQWQEVLRSSLAIYGVGNLSRSATNVLINKEDNLIEFSTIDKPDLMYVIYLKKIENGERLQQIHIIPNYMGNI